jgi:hypothetical protein
MFTFELTLDEANLVLAALGKAPFEQVAGLIGKIREQAQPQLASVEAAEAAKRAAAEAAAAAAE